MSCFYGIYASTRDAAWRCQLDFGVCRLPVKLMSITRMAGIRVVCNSSTGELRRGESGASIFSNGRWYIVYDDSLPPSESRMVLAHELGHILLGHDYKYTSRRFPTSEKSSAGKLRCEREADMFAARLLAPACVLHELGITDARRISDICEIPYSDAVTRSRRMNVLEERDSYYKSPLERELITRFAGYISGMQPLSGGNPSSSRNTPQI